MIYTLVHTVLQSAALFPNKVAFTDGTKSLTYHALRNSMNQLASQLIELGVTKGDRVGVYLNRGLETSIAIYGIMRAGAIYVPLDSKAPAALTRFLIKDCGIKVLITNASQRKNVSTLVSEPNILETIIGVSSNSSIPSISWEQVANQSVEFKADIVLLEDDPAYIIYTSGSTGSPKGIVHSHRSGLSYAQLTADLYEITQHDKIANHAPVFFDISLLGYFTSPLVGATTLIIPDAYIALPASLSALIEKQKLTIWYSVPLALSQLLQSGVLEERKIDSLRWVLYAGEAFPPKYLRALMLTWPHARFSNIYGPAETNQCTYYHLPAPPTTDEPIPIGQVWGNTEMLILDENDATTKQGEDGELLIRSVTTMMGYWNNIALTEKSMYTRIGNQGFEEKFYRTGDIVRLDEKNVLHFLGRKDNQVKIRGYRVELDSIEASLVSNPLVSEAAVFTVQKNESALALQAVVVLHEQIETSAKELLDYLKAQIPFYAIPEQISILKDFPRTGSGKINRQAIKSVLLNE